VHSERRYVEPQAEPSLPLLATEAGGLSLLRNSGIRDRVQAVILVFGNRTRECSEPARSAPG
jgi:hypothetical protein